MSPGPVARRGAGGCPPPFMAPGSSSFTEFLGAHAPELLPSRPAAAARGRARGAARHDDRRARPSPAAWSWPATAAPRWATSSPTATWRRSSRADEYSGVGIAGTAGLAIELVKLFQVELEHYEKIEGTLLSLEGKANRLATMIRGNLGMAMQGLVGRAALRRVTTSTAATRPDLLLRRDRRLLRGARPPQRRLGLAVRARVAEEAVAPGPGRRRRRAGRRRGAVRRRRRRLRHRRPRPRPADLADAWPSSTPRGCASCPTTQLAAVVEQIVAAPPRQPAEVRDDACRSTSRPSS